MSKEALARVKINKLLESAGWRFENNADGPANIKCEHRITKKPYANSELGDDFEKAQNGFIDYLLLNSDKRPIALIEAKRESINPLNAKEQAREYARSISVRHIFLSNGNMHYYWDLQNGNPIRISKFLSNSELGIAQAWSPNPEAMARVEIDENYIAVSMDAQWNSYTPSQKATVAINKDIRILRDYQLEAIKKVQSAYVKGNRNFLLEMATGTGKTLLSAAIIKMFLRSGNADRVLFLVDRLELETQAYKNFQAYLASDSISSVIFKDVRDNWATAQIVITTIQSLSSNNRYLSEFTPNDFHLIISDEAHRTLGGNNRVIFDYFIGSKLGLTATPRDYLKGVNQAELQNSDPRQLERRLMLDTYDMFGCKDGVPTFRYSLLDAVNHEPPYLVNPFVLDARTTVTTDLLSKKGWSVKLTAEDLDEQTIESETYFKKDFEKKFFSPETNSAFVKAFLANAKRDPITGEIGKTIFFAVTRNHARIITELLNKEIENIYPHKYNSDFAIQITSDIPLAQSMTVSFATNNLKGFTNFNPELIDYKSSKARVCVTVGMMTTGYDCQDILNVVLARPIFSPSLFIQIKGRGTRLWTFSYDDKDIKYSEKKDNFYLFDFFANCEYFEKEFKYGEVLELPPLGTGTGGETPPPSSGFTYTGPDNLVPIVKEQIGLSGMKIDREAFSKGFEAKTKEDITNNPSLLEAADQEEWDVIIQHVQDKIFNQPTEYWNREKLQESYNVDRRLSLREIVMKAIGKITRFKSRDELADEEFERLLSVDGVDGSKYYELRELFKAYCLFDDIRPILDNKEYPRLATEARLPLKTLEVLGKEQIDLTLNYIKDNVSINKYLKA